MTDEKTTAPGAEATAAPAEHRGKRQERTGVVTSAKMQKTIVVKVTRAVAHPLYHRVITIFEKVLRARREWRSARRRHSSNRIIAAALEAEAVASCRSCRTLDARGLKAARAYLREHEHGSDEDVADGGR